MKKKKKKKKFSKEEKKDLQEETLCFKKIPFYSKNMLLISIKHTL